MKIFSVIDTNVLVSALLKYDSIPGVIVKSAVTGKIIPVLSEKLSVNTMKYCTEKNSSFQIKIFIWLFMHLYGMEHFLLHQK